MDELRRVAVQQSAILALIQEPYGVRGTYNALGLTTRVISGPPPPASRYGPLPLSDSPRSIIAVFGRNMDVLALRDLSDSFIVVAQLSLTATLRVYVLSVYIPPTAEDLAFTNRLNFILGTLDTRFPIILGGDINGQSPIWHAGCANARGSSMAELFSSWDLFTLNEASYGPTFSTVNGTSFIDVTAVSSALLTRCSSWKHSRDSVPSSDHSLISFIFKNTSPSAASSLAPGDHLHRLDTYVPGDSTNWARFSELLNSLLHAPPSPVGDMSPNDLVDFLSRSIARASSRTMRARTARTPAAPPWWSNDLQDLRRTLATKSRLLRRLRASRGRDDPSTINQARHLGLLRSTYRRAIRRAKANSWHRLLSENASTPWNFIFKVAFKKIRPEQVWIALSAPNPSTQAPTTDVISTVDMFLKSLFPRAPTPSTSADYEPPPAPLIATESPFTTEELILAAKAIKPRKAPGLDGICGETAKRVLTQHSQFCLDVFNKCLSSGRFPSSWKQGSLCLLLKDPVLPPDVVKSYRPITLLPILGKTLERLMCYRLRPYLSGPAFRTPHQFGFVPGKSSVDALMSLRQFVTASQKRYVLAVSIDITAAFDTMSWKTLFRRLREANLPGNLFELLVSYMVNRSVSVRGETFSRTVIMERGCPQGSVLGPELWNAVFNELIILLAALAEVYIVAYADDLLLVVEGDSRASLERSANTCLEEIRKWTLANDLTVAAHKCSSILLKGILANSRHPHLRLGQTVLPYSTSLKYLGILIGERFSMAAHVRNLRMKITRTFAGLARVVRFQWRLSDRALSLIYDGVFVPAVSYGAPFWAFSVDKADVSSQLDALQRFVLLSLFPATSTVATDSLRALAGRRPVQHDIKLACERYLIKLPARPHICQILYENRRSTIIAPPSTSRGPRPRYRRGVTRGADPINDLNLSPRHYSSPGRVTALETNLLSAWQTSWSSSTKGEITKLFLPTVAHARGDSPLPLASYSRATLYVLTGHGPYRAKLYSFSLSESPACLLCNTPDTWHHAILSCTIFNPTVSCPRLHTLHTKFLSIFNYSPPDLLSQTNIQTLVDFSELWLIHRRLHSMG